MILEATLKEPRLNGICGHRLQWKANGFGKACAICCKHQYISYLIVQDGKHTPAIKLEIWEVEEMDCKL